MGGHDAQCECYQRGRLDATNEWWERLSRAMGGVGVLRSESHETLELLAGVLADQLGAGVD